MKSLFDLRELSLRKAILLAAGVLAVLVIALAAGFFLARARSAAKTPAGSKAAFIAQADLPTDGWQVCADNGMGTVPGVNEQRQRFELCQGQGWRVQAYCLNPGIPAPQVGAFCSTGDGQVFWCGQGVQEVQIYGVMQTPAPTQPATLTPTQTATALPTATRPASTETPMIGQAEITFTPTARPRPAAGGPGNADTTSAWTADRETLDRQMAERERILRQSQLGGQPDASLPAAGQLAAALGILGIIAALMLVWTVWFIRQGRLQAPAGVTQAIENSLRSANRWMTRLNQHLRAVRTPRQQGR